MKRGLIIIATIVNSTTIFSQSSNKDLYIDWALEDISKHNYRSALDNIDNIYNYPADYAIFLNYIWEEATRNNAEQYSKEAADKLVKIPLKYHSYRSLDNCALILSLRKEYKLSINFSNEQLKILKSTSQFNKDEYARVLQSIGDSYRHIGDNINADSTYFEALSYYGEDYTGNYMALYIYLLDNIADIYKRRGDYKNEIRYSTKAADWVKKNPTLNNIMVLLGLALRYSDNKEYEVSNKIYHNALSIIIEFNREDHPYNYDRDLYFAYSQLALNYKIQLEYREAIKFYKMAIPLAEELYGSLSEQYIRDNLLLSQIYTSIHEFGLSENILLTMEESLSYDINNHWKYLIDIYSNLVIMYDVNKDYIKCIFYHKKRLNLLKMYIGTNSDDYVNELYSYALCNYSIYNYEESIESLIEICRIEKQNGITKKYLEFYAQLANAYRLNCDEKQAIKLYNEVLSICDNNEFSPFFIGDVYNQMGLIYMESDFIKSEKMFKTALQIQQNATGIKIYDYAATLNNIGLLYSHNGLYGDAEKYLLKSYEIYQSPFDTIYGFGMGRSYASVLKNLSELYISINKLDEAKKYSEQSLKYCIELNGINSLTYASIMHTMGDIELLQKNYYTAEQDYIRALNVRKENVGETSELCALTYNALGVLYRFAGNYSKSLEAFSQAYQIYSNLGVDLFTINNNLADIHWLLGNYSDCIKNLNIALESANSYVNKYFSFLTDKQRAQYWTQFQENVFEYGYNMIFDTSTKYKQYAEVAYSISLLAKGILLDTEKYKIAYIETSENCELKSKWNTLKTKRMLLVKLQSEDNMDKSEWEKLTNECEILDKEIAYLIPAYYKSIKYNDVVQNVPSNSLAIEFINFPLLRKGNVVTKKDSTMYCALLLRHDSEYPELIPLFEEKEVLSLINTTTENLTNHTYSYEGNGAELSEKIWGKILPHIKQGETVYFAPSGLLHQLAIEALPYDETQTMSDMFNLVRLSSTREIVTRKDELQHSTATLYGGIQYNMDTTDIKAESERYPEINLLASRGIENDTLNRGSVKDLPQTKTEVENINRMLKDNKLRVQLFTSTAANEESFKALSGRHQNILHIATHGFFWEDSTARKKDYFSQRMLMRMSDDMPALPTIDPLNRCGLLFAGANTALQGHSNELPEGVQDGILTAKEISLLDLRDADLVVLSACETGKGEITGDGVFGLQRAFKQAGAQTIIMSLWPVNDAATQLLMTEFYRNWITLHQPKREAFRNAQTTVRAQYPESTYWAGFIMLD